MMLTLKILFTQAVHILHKFRNGTIGTIQNYSWQGIINPQTMDSKSGLNYILLIAINYSFISEVILSPCI